MPVQIKLSGIFDKAKRNQAFTNAVSKSVREFAKYVPEQQDKATHTGKVRTIGRGKGFVRKHRASAKGERPAKISGKLRNSTKHKMTGQFSGEVETIAKSKGFDYAAQLEKKMDRPIQDAPEDIKAAQDILDKNAEKAIKSLA